MTSLRERIEKKTRRTAVFPLQVGDTAAASAQVAAARAQLDLHQQQARERANGGAPSDEDAKRTIVLRGKLKEAKDREADTIVDVHLQSLPPDVWEAVSAAAPDDDEDYMSVLPELLAESCTDESLRDADWWREQLYRPEFTLGDRYAALNCVTGLNLNVPRGHQGKG